MNPLDIYDKDANMNIYNNQYIDGKWLFSKIYDAAPCILGMGGIDADKAITELKEKYSESIMHDFYYKLYKKKKKGFVNYVNFIPLKDGVMMAFEQSFVSVFFVPGQEERANLLKEMVLKYHKEDKQNDFEMNLIVQSSQGLELAPLIVNRKKFDIKKHYEDDFVEIDAIICKRLNKKNDKGIVLLHGLPGTGKTTYLRYLIGKLKKRVMFLPPSIAGNITNPDFVNILIENPNSILIIEDAENIITDRKESGNSVVSNLLNLSDGLLGDCLSSQIICTFNMPLTNVDEALLRKGRLIAKYEFKKLSIEKSQKLSAHLGFKTTVSEPMSVSEIYNQHEKDFVKEKKKVGFARS